MDNQNRIAISLPVFLLIIAIIVIIIIEICYGIFSSKKNENNNEITNSQENTNTTSDINNSNNLNTSKASTMSEEEAKKILLEKYELAINLYELSKDYFNWANEPTVINDEYYLELTNYDEVLNNNFSSTMFNDFEKNAICLEIINGTAYIAQGGGGFSSFAGVEEFNDIKITEDEISSIVKTKHNDINDNFYGYEDNPFILVKKGNNWLIDKYVYSN